ncbi:YbaB/EbfC family nucleoid-associated protein [Dactylosporangium sp. AC04546]|uniref:YbaB/EbfC family nucleoid-associated protein n=1 Tax=Dactylosporangium sp. AC04546 TaxID=2862460 RepID=UPI001EE103CB|nr:YbaB/EbfC family nucleoid-associated protein [Dactylosporangium sp. AC04546]WVK86666.1 YbaB/EbfC family nucleoid-associated protein [Dactylosporangium sp. AC04546]
MLNEVMAEIGKQKASLSQLHDSIQEVTGSARSARRQVSVTVDARGDITGLTFHGNSYRNLAPAELADIIVTTIRQAQQSARTAVLESVSDSLPEGADVADIVSGRFDWGAAVTDAVTLPQSVVDLLGSMEASLGHRRGSGAAGPPATHDDTDAAPPAATATGGDEA